MLQELLGAASHAGRDNCGNAPGRPDFRTSTVTVEMALRRCHYNHHRHTSRFPEEHNAGHPDKRYDSASWPMKISVSPEHHALALPPQRASPHQSPRRRPSPWKRVSEHVLPSVLRGNWAGLQGNQGKTVAPRQESSEMIFESLFTIKSSQLCSSKYIPGSCTT